MISPNLLPEAGYLTLFNERPCLLVSKSERKFKSLEVILSDEYTNANIHLGY